MKKLYVACSMGMYETPEYDLYLSRIRADYPEYEILEPKKIYHSNEEWLKGWRVLHTDIDMLVFFADTQGYIGSGVHLEIHTCDPVFCLLNYEYIPMKEVQFSRCNMINRVQYRRVLGKKIPKRDVSRLVTLSPEVSDSF